MRAARLYRLAVRITDDINGESTSFTYADLARVRDELRTLATDAAVAGMSGDRGLPSRAEVDASGTITRLFREIAARLEHRIAGEEIHPVRRLDPEPRA
jgi:hypothetical protein